MWHALFHLDMSVWEKILRTVLVYALIVVLFRFVGKRSLGALDTLDFVVMFLLSNVVQNAIIGDDNTVVGGAVGAVTLVVVDAALDRVVYRWSWARKLLEGTSTVIVDKGKLRQKMLGRLMINRAELDHAIRLQNGNDIGDVWHGTLEPGGQLILSMRSDRQSADHGDIIALREQLDRIEALLAGRPASPEAAGGD